MSIVIPSAHACAGRSGASCRIDVARGRQGMCKPGCKQGAGGRGTSTSQSATVKYALPLRRILSSQSWKRGSGAEDTRRFCAREGVAAIAAWTPSDSRDRLKAHPVSWRANQRPRCRPSVLVGQASAAKMCCTHSVLHIIPMCVGALCMMAWRGCTPGAPAHLLLWWSSVHVQMNVWKPKRAAADIGRNVVGRAQRGAPRFRSFQVRRPGTARCG